MSYHCGFLSICIGGSLFATPLQPPDRYPKLPILQEHPGHYPFISFLTFRNVCDHVIDNNTEWFDPDVVGPGDIIYINIWYLEWFAEKVHDLIRHPYILVSCDVGAWGPEPYLRKLLYDPKLAAWFCRNMIFSYHPKLFQIPMGQDITLFNLNYNAIAPLVEAVAKKPFPKKHLLHMCFFPRPFGDRDKIVKMFENKPFCFSRNRSDQAWSGVGLPAFYEDLGTSQFTLSPVGFETDCVRTWEALVLGCIPIVEHSFLDPLYEGLPIVKVHKWEEIDEKFLKEKQEELKSANCEKAYFDYWHKMLIETQVKVQNNDLSSAALEATQFNLRDLADLTEILDPNIKILYRGFLTALRPLQLSRNLFLYDPWMSRQELSTFASRIKDPLLVKNLEKISLLESEEQFNSLLCQNNSYAIFLDLTYYRASLRMVDDKHNRHSLKNDLAQLCQQMHPRTLICGSKVSDTYVKEVLDQFSKENFVEIQKKGDFWFFTKEAE